ncbi:hypothetical protein D9M68_786690 [compost metagenome]
MTASILIAQTHDLPGIARAAGQFDDLLFHYAAGRLYVAGVTQEDLEAAAATHDPLPAAQRAKLVTINQDYEVEFAALKGQYPESERESWPIQLKEAEVLLVNPQASTPFLGLLAAERGFGETVSELAAKVRAKNEAYGVLSATLTAKRHRLERQILTCSEVEEVEAVSW